MSRQNSASTRSIGPLGLALTVPPPLFAIALLVTLTGRGGSVGIDFGIFRDAAHALVHGRSPYVHPTLALLSANTHYVYPAPFAYLFAPFLLIPQRAAAIVFLLVSVGAIVATLRLLDVTDPRLYGLAILGAPVFDALNVGGIEPLLLLAVAAAWKLRHSAWAGVLLALAAAAKLFLWPLLIWLLVTRRWRATLAATATLVVVVAVWALVDAHGLSEYPRTLRDLELGHPSSYSLRGLWIALGLPGAEVLGPVVAMIGIWILARVRDDRAAVSLAIAVALLSTPLLWLHYLAMLLVPLALFRPRLSWPWLVPLALWATPASDPYGDAWKMAFVLAAIVVVSIASLRRRPLPLTTSSPGWVSSPHEA